ncbi:MAG: hypothetical protein JWN30_1321 [Bacilli bacterium]|nr:hypothetical protein [Bacilli bacterium]
MSDILGIVLHDSDCEEIRTAGYDFYVCRDGTVIPSHQFTADDYLHIVIEGHFGAPRTDLGVLHEQMFVLVKLIIKLAKAFDMVPHEIISHGDECPGPEFPWHELTVRIDRLPH